jgi:hypothetical protein
MTIITNFKNYFTSKLEVNSITLENKIYDNFINEVAKNLDK